jgi:signal transduction histidine kinase/CheY-like chemotaxis protein
MAIILHVDDDHNDRYLFKLNMSKLWTSCNVLPAENITDAQELLKSMEIDAIVCDFSIPGGNGIELLESIRKNGSNLPFIMLTGAGDEMTASSSFRAGTDDYIIKQSGSAYYEKILDSLKKTIESRNQELNNRSIEEANLQANLLLNKFFSLPNQLFFQFSPSLKVIRHSKSAKSEFSMTQPILTGLHIQDIFPASDIMQNLQQVFDTGLPGKLQAAKLQPNSSKSWDVSISPIFELGGGTTSALLNLKETVENLEISEEFRNSMIREKYLRRIMKFEMMLCDVEGNITFASKGCGAYLNIADDQICCTNLFEHLHEQKRYSVFQMLKNISAPPHQARIDEKIELNGFTSHISWKSMSVIEEDDQPNGFLATLQDISVFHEIGEDLQLSSQILHTVNQELDSFTQATSQNLRSPLSTIIQSCQMIDESADLIEDEDIRNLFSIIKRSAGKLDELTINLQHLHEVSKNDIDLQLFNLSAIALDILSNLKRNDPDKIVEFDIQEKIEIRADKNLCHILLRELLTNAWKFTERDQALISLKQVEVDGNEMLMLSDNGVGFDEKFADQIFGVFNRFHSGKTYPGTGIGLATAKRIVNRHGGRIYAKSKSGEGSQFYFTLTQQKK